MLVLKNTSFSFTPYFQITKSLFIGIGFNQYILSSYQNNNTRHTKKQKQTNKNPLNPKSPLKNTEKASKPDLNKEGMLKLLHQKLTQS
jgi:hypothetical protein